MWKGYMENQSICEHKEKSKNLSENGTWKECQNNKIIGNLKFKTIKIKNLRWGYYEIGIEIKENISWKRALVKKICYLTQKRLIHEAS